MALKVKVGLIGPLDMLKFKKMAATREAAIEKAPAKEISGEFTINQKAAQLHPDYQKLYVADIMEHAGADAKTYVLARADGLPAAAFRAGQYLSVALRIENSLLTRPYSISSSPQWAREGKYAMTVKRDRGGFASGWILDNWERDTTVTASGPQGDFYYEELRDAPHVVALAGGSGVTPFLSMAYAVRDDLEDFDLTLLYGSRTLESILFKKELDALCAQCKRVKVVYVLSDEAAEGCEQGFLNAALVEKYAQAPYSLFICGPAAMYAFLQKELTALKGAPRSIRRELSGVTRKVGELPEYPAAAAGKTFTLTVLQGEAEYEIPARADEPLLTAIERAGLPAPSRCRSGECGYCRSKLLAGDVFLPPQNEHRRWADKENGYVHPCCSFPLSDIKLEVPGAPLF